MGLFFRSVYLPLVSCRLSFVSPSRRASLLVPFGPLSPFSPYVVVPVPTPQAVLMAVVGGGRGRECRPPVVLVTVVVVVIVAVVVVAVIVVVVTLRLGRIPSIRHHPAKGRGRGYGGGGGGPSLFVPPRHLPADPIVPVLLLPVSTPQAVAHSGSWGCCVRSSAGWGYLVHYI